MTYLSGIDNIKSNHIPYCANCGVGITKYNDSGWESFVDGGGKSQPICKHCHYKLSNCQWGKPVNNPKGKS